MISLVYNKDSERLKIIRPNIQGLKRLLKEDAKILSSETCWQPIPNLVSRRIALKKDKMGWKLERKLNAYKKTKNLPYFIDLFRLIAKTFRKYILFPKLSKNWIRLCAIEMFLMQKHLLLLSNAIEEKIDYLIVFEEDAIFKEDSNIKIK